MSSDRVQPSSAGFAVSQFTWSLVDGGTSRTDPSMPTSWCSPASGSAVGGAAVADFDHQNEQLIVLDAIEHPVVAGADAPDIIRSAKLDRPGAARLLGQLVDPPRDATLRGSVEVRKLSGCRR